MFEVGKTYVNTNPKAGESRTQRFMDLQREFYFAKEITIVSKSPIANTAKNTYKAINDRGDEIRVDDDDFVNYVEKVNS